ncbi:hypothetical protein KI387_033810, partial [Taxus chinensis]
MGMENYEKLEKVGEGTYGKVYKAKDKTTGQLVALKKTRLEMDEEGIPPTALREVALLQMLSSSIYIVRLLCVEHVDKKGKSLLYLVFEYLDTDLKKFMDCDRRSANANLLSPIVIQIATLWYRAPEVLLGSTHYSTPVDIWSVGCIFAEMVKRRPLFPGDSELEQLLHIFRLLGTPNKDIWPGVNLLRDWHEYPQWNPQNLARAVPTLSPSGCDLLT